METKTETEELEDEVHEAIVEAIDSKDSMDDLNKAIGQKTLKWFLGKQQKRKVATRRYFDLRKVKREDKPDQK